MPDTTPTTELRAQLGQALRRWGLLDEVNDPAATEEFAVTDLMAVLREPLARLVLGTTDQQPATAECTCITTPEVDDSGQVLHGSYCMTVIDQPPTPPAEVCTEHGAACHTRQWPAPGAVTEAVADDRDEVERYRTAWRSATRRANVLCAELTRRAPLLGEYATEIERLRGLLWAKHGATRRMADEAQQPDTPKTAPLATPCNLCTHTLNWHRNEGGCSVHACYCRSWQQPTADEAQQPETEAAADTLPAWLYQRFMTGGVGWDNLDDDDRSYWEHHARAVRRAVARNGFKPAADRPDTETEAAPDPADLNRQLSTTCTCGHALRWHLPDCRKGSGHGCPCLSFTPDTETEAAK